MRLSRHYFDKPKQSLTPSHEPIVESGQVKLPPIVPTIEALTVPVSQGELPEIIPEIEPYSPPINKQDNQIVAIIEEYNDDEWEYYWEEEEEEPPEPPVPPAYQLLHYWDMVAGSGTDYVIDSVGNKNLTLGYGYVYSGKPSWGQGYLSFTDATQTAAQVAGISISPEDYVFPSGSWSMTYWLYNNSATAGAGPMIKNSYHNSSNPIFCAKSINTEMYGVKGLDEYDGGFETVCVSDKHVFVGRYDNSGFTIRKYDKTDLRFISANSGNPIGKVSALCTDDTYLYVLTSTSMFYKLSADDFSTITSRESTYWGQLATDGTYIYANNSTTIDKISCSDLSVVDSFGDEELVFAASVACDKNGDYIYVMDSDGYSLIKMSKSDGTIVATIGEQGNGDGYDGDDAFGWVYGIGCDDTYLYVCDGDNGRIQKRRKSDLVMIYEIRDSDYEWTFDWDWQIIGYTMNVCGDNSNVYMIHGISGESVYGCNLRVMDTYLVLKNFRHEWGWWVFDYSGISPTYEWMFMTIVVDYDNLVTGEVSEAPFGVRLYYNKELIDQYNEDAIPGPPPESSGSIALMYYTDGYIGPIAIFSGILDQAGVDAMYESGKAILGIT